MAEPKCYACKDFGFFCNTCGYPTSPDKWDGDCQCGTVDTWDPVPCDCQSDSEDEDEGEEEDSFPQVTRISYVLFPTIA